MRRYFIDTSVIALAVGGEHPLRSRCRWLVTAATAGEIEVHVSTEAIQELVHHRMRRDTRERAVGMAREAARLFVTHPFDDRVLDQALTLILGTTLRGRDAVHAATALAHGFGEIVSVDKDFDGVSGLTRIDPVNLERT